MFEEIMAFKFMKVKGLIVHCVAFPRRQDGKEGMKDYLRLAR